VKVDQGRANPEHGTAGPYYLGFELVRNTGSGGLEKKPWDFAHNGDCKVIE